ncbi:MAG: enhancer of rudimentary [Monoraphidium minutum]|nr:MAG: enhancer of rudimentary [Monoraphidium minutum]
MGKHTILLMQTKGRSSRTYHDFENEQAAVAALIGMFEQRLFELNPNQPYLQYEPRDVGVFVDSMPHIGLLVYDDRTGAYVPHAKPAIKQRAEQHLRSRAR